MSAAFRTTPGKPLACCLIWRQEFCVPSALTFKSDIWALGTMLYEIAAGKLPLHRSGDTMKLAWESWSNNPNRFRTASIPPSPTPF